MRVAILADIHGNLPALDAVLEDATNHNIDAYWCLGDVVGYGPWPVQCWKQVRALGISEDAWVLGNHELGLINKLCREFYSDGDAKTVLEYHLQICERDHIDILDQISQMKAIVQPMPGVILSHGAPKPDDVLWTVTKYTQTELDAEQALSALSAITPKLIAVGHSHKPMFWRRTKDDRQAQWIDEPIRDTIPLGDPSHQPVYCNPGSVGQPRDLPGGARYCYIDWDGGAVCFRRVPYPVELTRAKMQNLQYPQKLIDQWYASSGEATATPMEQKWKLTSNSEA